MALLASELSVGGDDIAVGTAHLLRAISQIIRAEPAKLWDRAAEMLTKCDVSPNDLDLALAQLPSNWTREESDHITDNILPWSPRAKAVMNQAQADAKRAGRGLVQLEDVLIALVAEPNGEYVEMLRLTLNLSPEQLREALLTKR